MEQLSFEFKADQEAWDLLADFLNQCHHTSAFEEIQRYRQTFEPYKKLMATPQMKEAEKRRKDLFWDRCNKAAERVNSWPDWMKGSSENRRSASYDTKADDKPWTASMIEADRQMGEDISAQLDGTGRDLNPLHYLAGRKPIRSSFAETCSQYKEAAD